MPTTKIKFNWGVHSSFIGDYNLPEENERCLKKILDYFPIHGLRTLQVNGQEYPILMLLMNLGINAEKRDYFLNSIRNINEAEKYFESEGRIFLSKRFNKN